MSSFYIDRDVRNNKTYIASYTKDPIGPYVIECEKAYQADTLVKKLNAGAIKGPAIDETNYERLEDLVNSLGSVKVFRYKGEL